MATMKVQVFELVSRNKIVGVLGSGGVGEIYAAKGMSDEVYKYLSDSHLFCPKIVTASEMIWNCESKQFECDRIEN